MAGFDDPAFYGDRWASVYDDQHGRMDPEPAAEFLAGMAGDGRVLELAIGTGRVALPLAARGIRVEGVDASPAMIERLRAKPGGESIPVTVGDMAQVPVSGRFRLVYLVCNTLFGLLTQERQAECFGNVTRVLEPGGVFVIECFVPDVARFDHDQRVEARSVTEDSAVIEVSRHDKARQRVTTQMIMFDGQGMQLRPVAIRYSWPAELDLMAGRAGLRLAERYAGWDRRPFASASSGHVSVYERALVVSAALPESGLGKDRLEQLHGIARRVLGDDLPAARSAHDVVAESHATVMELPDERIEVGDLDREAVPAARRRHRPVRHRLTAARPAARRAEHQAQVATGEHREGRGGMHHLREAQVLRVERDRGVNVVDDVPDTYRRHGRPPVERPPHAIASMND
jgi:SAM-dependent methyltransferase